MVSPTIRSPRVGVSPAYERSNRVTRRPQHRFNLKTKPYQIQPLMIAPVLPGESLTNIMLQAQSWSDPLAAGVLRNIGWWKEYYFFYVKHRDLPGWERDELANQGLGSDLIDMIVNNGNLNAHKEANIVQWTYTPKGGVDYVKNALFRIVEEYFRDEGETAAAFHIDNVPIAQIYGRGQNDWSMRLTLEGDYEDRRVDLDVDNDGSITVDEVERAYIEWAAARDAGLMDMDYEDWIRTYGVKSTLPEIDRVDHHRPELLVPSSGVLISHEHRGAYYRRTGDCGWLAHSAAVSEGMAFSGAGLDHRHDRGPAKGLPPKSGGFRRAYDVYAR